MMQLWPTRWVGVQRIMEATDGVGRTEMNVMTING